MAFVWNIVIWFCFLWVQTSDYRVYCKTTFTSSKLILKFINAKQSACWVICSEWYHHMDRWMLKSCCVIRSPWNLIYTPFLSLILLRDHKIIFFHGLKRWQQIEWLWTSNNAILAWWLSSKWPLIGQPASIALFAN